MPILASFFRSTNAAQAIRLRQTNANDSNLNGSLSPTSPPSANINLQPIGSGGLGRRDERALGHRISRTDLDFEQALRGEGTVVLREGVDMNSLGVVSGGEGREDGGATISHRLLMSGSGQEERYRKDSATSINGARLGDGWRGMESSGGGGGGPRSAPNASSKRANQLQQTQMPIPMIVQTDVDDLQFRELQRQQATAKSTVTATTNTNTNTNAITAATASFSSASSIVGNTATSSSGGMANNTNANNSFSMNHHHHHRPQQHQYSSSKYSGAGGVVGGREGSSGTATAPGPSPASSSNDLFYDASATLTTQEDAGPSEREHEKERERQQQQQTNRRSLYRSPGTSSSPDLATLLKKAKERGTVLPQGYGKKDKRKEEQPPPLPTGKGISSAASAVGHGGGGGGGSVASGGNESGAPGTGQSTITGRQRSSTQYSNGPPPSAFQLTSPTKNSKNRMGGGRGLFDSDWLSGSPPPKDSGGTLKVCIVFPVPSGLRALAV